MSIESENKSVLRLRSDLSKLKADLAKAQKDLASYESKKVSAENALRKSKNASTIKSKLNEIERHSKAIVSASNKISDIQNKISKKEHDLVNAQKKYEKTKVKEEEKTQKESAKKFKNVSKTLRVHEKEQDLLHKEILKLKEPPEEITILFLASNPINTSFLGLDEEARAIQEKIRLSEYRDTLKFETRWAVRTGDLLQAINETNPTIIHFSGHGDDYGNLVLQNPDKTPKLISPDAISQAISTVSDDVKLVFFNACHSEAQALNIVNHIDVAIGMSDSIRDDTACIFAAQFYSSLGFGLSVEQAFNQAKAELILESIPGEDIPRLHSKSEIDINEMYLVKKH